MRSYISKKQKKKNCLTAGCFFAMIAAALSLIFIGQNQIFTIISQELEQKFCKEMVSFYLPSVSYQNTEPSVLEKIWTCFFPLLDCTDETWDYETNIESSLSYEMILAMEASDENYVDQETGKVILQSEVKGEQVQEEGIPEESSAAEMEEILQDTGLNLGIASAGGEKVVTYSLDKLADFDYLIQNFYQVDKTTTINSSQLNAEEMLNKNLQLSHDASEPQILIYHTHSQEGYADSIPGDLETTVVGVGEELAKILKEQYGLNVIHHTGTYDAGDRDHAYSKAGPALEQILAENPGIEVVIDLHRDGVREDTRLVTNIGGVEMAKIMFFNGLSRTTSTGDIDYLYNPYIEDNLAFSFQMQLTAAEYYPDLTRKVYLKGYRYNMHYCPKTLLVEVGAQTNTLQEAKNAMEPLADILNKVLTGGQ